MRSIGLCLILMLIATPAFAETAEVSALTAEAKAPNFWQEMDITFWQTLPFAAFWGHFIDRQVSIQMFPGSDPHWNVIMTFATMVSASNAFFHAQRVMEESKE
jgi:hypothetical protein